MRICRVFWVGMCTLGRKLLCASICAVELTPDDNISRTPFCQQNVIQKCRERTKEEFAVVIIHWCALILFFFFFFSLLDSAHTVQAIGVAFIVTEILIPSVFWTVYLLWVFMYLSSGWLDEEKKHKKWRGNGFGPQYHGPALHYSTVLRQILNENPRKVDGSPYLIKPL